MAEKEPMSIWKSGWQVWLRLILASLLCFVVWLSIDAMAFNFVSDVTGYEIYAFDENGENPQLVTSHTYTEGEDRTAEIKLEENQVMMKTRTVAPGNKAVINVISSVFTWLIFGLFPYNMMWEKGDHDENFVHIGRIKQDTLFGLKAGLVATIPSAILYLLLILGKFGVFPPEILKWHRLINTAFIPYIDAVEMGANTAPELSFGSLLAVGATLLFVPLVCCVGYYLGFRHISIRERMVYKKNNAKNR